MDRRNGPSPWDAYAPDEIAQRVETAGIAKAAASTLKLITLAVLAGAFISLGAVFYTVTISASTLGFGMTKLIGGMAFSLGLILVVVAGAELFTGNNLIAMAWASGKIGAGALLRNWWLVYLGNVAGAVATATLVWLADIDAMHPAISETATRIAAGKSELGVVPAFARAILCNTLVCLAVWLCFGCRSVADKILAIVFPITAFVACGFEHSIANWFFLPYAAFLGAGAETGYAMGAVTNLVVVTGGNIVGGSLLVALVYWLAYLRD